MAHAWGYGRSTRNSSRAFCAWTVFCLIPSDGARVIQQVETDFFATVRGQAMQEQHVLGREVEQGTVDLERCEQLEAFGGFLFLAHGGPDVGAHQVCAAHGILWIADDGHAIAGLGDEFRVGLVAFRAGDAQLEVELDRRFYIAVAHVVAVADPGHGLALDRATMLKKGLHVGQQLARVQVIGQAVDHRYARVGGKFGQGTVGESTDHHRIKHARLTWRSRRSARHAPVACRAAKERSPGRAELDHAASNGSGAGRGFLEDHPQHAVFQRLEQYAAVTQVLELNASTDHADQLFGRAIHQGEKVPCAHH